MEKRVTYSRILCKWMLEHRVRGIVKYKHCCELQKKGEREELLSTEP